MPRRDFLSVQERVRFDAPPQLNSSQQLILIDLPRWADDYLQAIHTPTNKVGFLLQLGYFRVVTARPLGLCSGKIPRLMVAYQ